LDARCPLSGTKPPREKELTPKYALFSASLEENMDPVYGHKLFKSSSGEMRIKAANRASANLAENNIADHPKSKKTTAPKVAFFKIDYQFDACEN
jgi:hypothetical protein